MKLNSVNYLLIISFLLLVSLAISECSRVLVKSKISLAIAIERNKTAGSNVSKKGNHSDKAKVNKSSTVHSKRVSTNQNKTSNTTAKKKTMNTSKNQPVKGKYKHNTTHRSHKHRKQNNNTIHKKKTHHNKTLNPSHKRHHKNNQTKHHHHNHNRKNHAKHHHRHNVNGKSHHHYLHNKSNKGVQHNKSHVTTQSHSEKLSKLHNPAHQTNKKQKVNDLLSKIANVTEKLKHINATSKVKMVKRKSLKKGEYSMAIFGDIGEYEDYKKSKKVLFKDFLVKNIDYKKTCNSHFSTKGVKGMVNFERVLKAMFKHVESDESCVLGDMVYPEQKGFGKIFRGLGVLSQKHLANKTLTKDEKEDWEKIKKLKSASQLAPRDKEVELRDNKLPHIDFKTKTVNGLKEIQNIIEKEIRLNCGWRYLHNIIKDTNKTPKWIAETIQLIFGNHSYDVDPMFEARFISKYFNKEMELKIPTRGIVPKKFTKGRLAAKDFIKPRLIKANTDAFSIVYIDIDPSLLICSDFLIGFLDYKDLVKKKKLDNFLKCHKSRQENVNYAGLEDPNEATVNILINYINDLLSLLESLRTYKSDWKIVRMHQPIFNVEFDFAGMKLNKELMKHFQKAHIHAWFVSHFHNAQFTLSLYERKYYKHQNISSFNPKALILTRPGNLEKKMKEYTGVWKSMDDFMFDADNKNKLMFEGKKIVTHVDRSDELLKHSKKTHGNNLIEISPNNEEYIAQILTGNSGRTLDPLYNDLHSDLVLVYGKAKFNGHGYTRARFFNNNEKQKCLEATYYSLNHDDSKLEENYKIHICQKEDFGETNREKIFHSLNDGNFNDNLLLEHLKKRKDPFA